MAQRYCAIDLGQTNVRWWVIEGEAVVGHGETGVGAVNIFREGGEENYIRNFKRVAAEVGYWKDIAFTLAGATGIGRERDDYNLCLKLMGEHLLGENHHLYSDSEILYAANLQGEAGCLLHAGTGNFALFRNSDGAFFRTGGWGYYLGDQGAGSGLALEGVRAAVKAFDRTAPGTPLADDFLDWLGAANPVEVRPRFYSATMDNQKIASFARIVCKRGEEGDPVALAILEGGAGELAELITPGKDFLCRDNFTVKCAGTLLLKDEFYWDLVTKTLHRKYPNINVERGQRGFIDGARFLGSEHLLL